MLLQINRFIVSFYSARDNTVSTTTSERCYDYRKGKKKKYNVREQYEADNNVGHQCLLEISGLLPV